MIMRILTIVLLLISCNSKAQNMQGTVDYTLTVKDTKLRHLAGAKVIFTEIDTRQKIFATTNTSGQLNIILKGGKEWLISINEIREEWSVKIPAQGESINTRTITYNYERWKRENRPPVDRSKLNIITIKQKITSKDQPSDSHGIFELKLKRKSGKPLANYLVGLTCYGIQKTFEVTTNKSGIARFKLPLNNEYHIDIDGIEEFQFYKMGKKPAYYSMEFKYEPSNVAEIQTGDTIVQMLKGQSSPTSNRAFFKLKVDQHGAGFAKGEPIYLKMLKSNKVYKAKTNEDGEADFLLPIQRKYLIDFNYEKDVDVIDLSKKKGFVNGFLQTVYIPQEKLQYPERFVPTPNQVFTKKFDEFIEKQYQAPKEQYLELYAKWGNPEVNSNSKEALLEIGFNSANRERHNQMIDQSNSPAINLCFVLDKSGSMAGYDRIESLQQSLLELSKVFRPKDIISLVIFDSQSRVSVPAQKFGNGAYIREMFKDIEAGGGTSIYNGLLKGFEEVNKNKGTCDASKVILLSDGYGSTPISEVIQLAKKHIDEGIAVSCIGVGEGYNQALLSQLATAGGGLMHYVGDAKKMNDVFVKEIISSIFPVARNAKAEVTYNDQLIYKQLYGFNAKTVNTEQFNMDIGNIYPGLNKLALVHFDLNKPTKTIEKDPLKIVLTYFDYVQNKKISQEKLVRLKWSEKTGELEFLIDSEHKKMLAIATMNRAIKIMAECHDRGETEKAKMVISTTISEINKIFPLANDEDVSSLLNDLITYTKRLDQMMLNKELERQ